ncbi:Hypothetical predicted protein [Marmota monax]|uniref:Uncharacterized protein n=1 Tax=Marmota monax TaxID=9995 RepID=A0A5E4ADW9_MARMO|nr:Hypothetical predicted protein [Marmota monax]
MVQKPGGPCSRVRGRGFSWSGQKALCLAHLQLGSKTPGPALECWSQALVKLHIALQQLCVQFAEKLVKKDQVTEGQSWQLWLKMAVVRSSWIPTKKKKKKKKSAFCYYSEVPEAAYVIKKRGSVGSQFWRLKVQTSQCSPK